MMFFILNSMCIVSATILSDVVTYKRSVVILTKKIMLIQSILFNKAT